MPLTPDADLSEALGQIEPYSLLPFLGRPLLITLPLECRLQRGRLAAYAFGMLLLALLGVLLAALALIPSMVENWVERGVAIAGGGLFALRFGAISRRAWRQARAPSLALLLDHQGFVDLRLGLRMAWGDVRKAVMRGETIRIMPKTASEEAQPSRRRGVLGLGVHRRRSDEIVIPLAFVGPRLGVPAYAMGVMIGRAGGEVKWA